MMPHLTIAYLTSRQDPKIQWMLDSLRLQLLAHSELKFTLVVVDFWKDQRDLPALECGLDCPLHHVTPKPCVWQGKHRITKEDFFAASNARNTALCLAPDGYIAYCDDLSVLMPGWLTNVVQSMSWHGITLGAYRKVKKLEGIHGVVTDFEDFPGGRDSRWNYGSPNGAVSCRGDMLFGCSLVGPVEAFLNVNGWPEICDGLSFEDVIMGIVLENAGYKFRYNRNMLTLESEEHHHLEKPFKRVDKGVSPNDKSHAILNMAKGGMKAFPGYYEGGIRKMRQEVLSGQPFPIVQIPEHDWYDGQSLREM